MADINEKDNSSGHSPERYENKESVDTSGENERQDVLDIGGGKKLNAIFENPLAGVEPEQLKKDVEQFCADHDLMDKLDAFQKV
jgi:hypothetical protein